MKNINLLASRFIFYIFCIFQIDPEYFLRFSNFPEAFWLPTGVFQWLSAPVVLGSLSVQLLSALWYITAVLAALNIRFRESSFFFAVLNLFIFNLAHNYGYQTHSFMAMVLGAFLLSLGGRNAPQLIKILFCMIFFSAGVSKLRNGGFDWIFSESLQNILIRSQIYYSDAQPWANAFKLNIRLAQNAVVCSVIAFAAVVLELAAPLALLGRRWSRLIVPSLLLMQVGIFFTILVNFKFYILMYVFWIDWESLFRKSVSWRKRRTVSA